MTTGSSLRAIPTTTATTPSARSEPSDGATLGECVRVDHPTLSGRALVRWEDAAGAQQERWLPTLMTVSVRPADRVLMLWPSNSTEPVVIGVVDGFAPRPARAPHGGPVLTLQLDEVVRVEARDGTPLLELAATDAGPLVRLLREDVSVELPGALRISARSIELSAQQGEVSIAATDDVVLVGAGIRLN